MKLSIFLEDIKKNQEEVVYYCCNHLLSKKFDINNDSVENEILKSLFILIDKHLTCVKDNHLYDTWDCEDYIIRKIWEVKDV